MADYHGDAIFFIGHPAFVDEYDHECRRVGTGRIIPRRFHPPNSNMAPTSLFLPRFNNRVRPPQPRFIHRGHPDKFLIYTDGSCLSNGRGDARAGCAFFFEPLPGNHNASTVSFRLENEGPTGEMHRQTSNRAELRAVIAVSRFLPWNQEGFTTLVIATDSEYVVKGATDWVYTWRQNGWMASNGHRILNEDLWLCLFGEVERWHDLGLSIEFWHIPRDWNGVADHGARCAARLNEQDSFVDHDGTMG